MIRLEVSSPLRCSLDSEGLKTRLNEWREMVSLSVGASPLPDGLRLSFPREVDVSSLAALAAAEQTCCGFFRFTINIKADRVVFEVTGPPEARPLVSETFGPGNPDA